jgi:hypothetical protein
VAEFVEFLLVAGGQLGTVLGAAMTFNRAGPTNPGALVEMLGMLTACRRGLPAGEGSEDGDGGSHHGQNMSAIHAILLQDESGRAKCAADFLMVNVRRGPWEGHGKESISHGATAGSSSMTGPPGFSPGS